MEEQQLSEFGTILIFLIGAVVFVMGGLITAYIIRPSRPNDQKLSTYESGEEPLGNAWVRFPVRFYLIAIIFLLFEVEIVFLFPWATVFGNADLIAQTEGTWGWFALIEMVIFILVLALGLAYAWAKGFLEWPKPTVEGEKDFKSPVPRKLYDQINERYS
ncbi:NADH-quinone oxidoreductase subunit A [Fulvivirga sp. RKSG066]|nr:NADH-quinone oxidoreductase subunit A [Fulvivirga aurantia]